MPHRISRQRLGGWLALIAMLAVTLLPTISHALALPRGGSAWTEICTPQGLRVVALDDAPETTNAAPSPGAANVLLEHCAYCAYGNGSLGLPPAAVAPLALPLDGAEPPPVFVHSPRTLLAWRSAQPRAPPSLS